MNPLAAAWTGGQYSVVRALVGLYLIAHFAFLLPYAPEVFSSAGALSDGALSPLLHAFPNVLALYDSPAFVQALLVLGCLAGAALALGWRDRAAAVLAWYLLACLFGRNPLIANPSLPYLGLLLLAHALHPPAPFGSLAALGRTDPRGKAEPWRPNAVALLALWVALAAGYSYSGWTKLISSSWRDGSAVEHVLANPLARPGALNEALLALPSGLLQAATWVALAFELAFLPLALFRRTRPLAWLAMLLMHLGLIAVIDFADLSLAMVLIHLATFDPRWIPGRGPGGLVLFDGSCGLCHRAVRFVLAEDGAGRFRFAPLGGATFERALPAGERATLPDSIVVRTATEQTHLRSDAIATLLIAIGGLWGLAGRALRLIPRGLRDFAYDAVARIRRRIFAEPKSACPMMPRDLGARFDL